MMQTLYQLEGSQFRIEVLAKPKVQEFIGAHAAVLDSGFRQVEMSDAMRRRLHRSDYLFSGMKTFHELHEAFPSLLDENGNRKSFEQFLNDVRKIDKTYNSNYLRAEYNFAQSSARMAAKWEEFSQDGDRYNLQYRTAHDDRVRPEHAVLHGITLPITDTFWEQHWPPLSWGCRCDVVQVRKSKYPVTPHDEAMALGDEAVGKNDFFRFNSGIQQKTFPDYNSYTIRRCKDCDIANGKTKLAKDFIPDNELCAACKLLHDCWKKAEKDAPETFSECNTANGKLRVSSKHGKNEKRENVRVGKYLTEKYGYEIDLIANPSDKKSPDSFNHTLGVYQEYKVNSTSSKSSIDNLLRVGSKQADNIVLVIESDISLTELSNAMNSRVRRTSIKKVTVVMNGMDHTYSFDEITADGFIIKQADLK